MPDSKCEDTGSQIERSQSKGKPYQAMSNWKSPDHFDRGTLQIAQILSYRKWQNPSLAETMGPLSGQTEISRGLSASKPLNLNARSSILLNVL